MMKHLISFVIVLTLSVLTYGQKIYRSEMVPTETNKFIIEFYVFNDSTCILKEHYEDNSNYFLYEGQLRKTNDTLYEFNFQPVVKFGLNKRYKSGDTLGISLTQKDTTLQSVIFKLKAKNNDPVTIQLKSTWTKVYVQGSGKGNVSMDTKFIDPQTKKLIYVTVDQHSEPDLTYYGSTTAMESIRISIVNDKLTIYPKNNSIRDKETLLLVK